LIAVPRCGLGLLVERPSDSAAERRSGAEVITARTREIFTRWIKMVCGELMATADYNPINLAVKDQIGSFC